MWAKRRGHALLTCFSPSLGNRIFCISQSKCAFSATSTPALSIFDKLNAANSPNEGSLEPYYHRGNTETVSSKDVVLQFAHAAKAKISRPHIWHELTKSALLQLTKYSAVEILILLQAYGASGYRDLIALQALSEALYWRAWSAPLSPRILTGITHSFCRLSPTLRHINTFLETIRKPMYKWNPKDNVNLFRFLVQFKLKDEIADLHLYDDLYDRIMLQFGTMYHYELAAVCKTVSQISPKERREEFHCIFERLCQHCMRTMKSIPTTVLMQLSQSLLVETLPCLPSSYMEILRCHTLDHLNTLKPYTLAFILIILRKYNYRDERILKAIAERVEQTAKTFSSKQLASVLYSFALLNYRPTKFISSISTTLFDVFESQDADSSSLISSQLGPLPQFSMSPSKTKLSGNSNGETFFSESTNAFKRLKKGFDSTPLSAPDVPPLPTLFEKQTVNASLVSGETSIKFKSIPSSLPLTLTPSTSLLSALFFYSSSHNPKKDVNFLSYLVDIVITLSHQRTRINEKLNACPSPFVGNNKFDEEGYAVIQRTDETLQDASIKQTLSTETTTKSLSFVKEATHHSHASGVYYLTQWPSSEVLLSEEFLPYSKNAKVCVSRKALSSKGYFSTESIPSLEKTPTEIQYMPMPASPLQTQPLETKKFGVMPDNRRKIQPFIRRDFVDTKTAEHADVSLSSSVFTPSSSYVNSTLVSRVGNMTLSKSAIPRESKEFYSAEKGKFVPILDDVEHAVETILWDSEQWLALQAIESSLALLPDTEPRISSPNDCAISISSSMSVPTNEILSGNKKVSKPRKMRLSKDISGSDSRVYTLPAQSMVSHVQKRHGTETQLNEIDTAISPLTEDCISRRLKIPAILPQGSIVGKIFPVASSVNMKLSQHPARRRWLQRLKLSPSLSQGRFPLLMHTPHPPPTSTIKTVHPRRGGNTKPTAALKRVLKRQKYSPFKIFENVALNQQKWKLLRYSFLRPYTRATEEDFIHPVGHIVQRNSPVLLDTVLRVQPERRRVRHHPFLRKEVRRIVERMTAENITRRQRVLEGRRLSLGASMDASLCFDKRDRISIGNEHNRRMPDISFDASLRTMTSLLQKYLLRRSYLPSVLGVSQRDISLQKSNVSLAETFKFSPRHLAMIAESCVGLETHSRILVLCEVLAIDFWRNLQGEAIDSEEGLLAADLKSQRQVSHTFVRRDMNRIITYTAAVLPLKLEEESFLDTLQHCLLRYVIKKPLLTSPCESSSSSSASRRGISTFENLTTSCLLSLDEMASILKAIRVFYPLECSSKNMNIQENLAHSLKISTCEAAIFNLDQLTKMTPSPAHLPAKESQRMAELSPKAKTTAQFPPAHRVETLSYGTIHDRKHR
ncbi:hypothetical protein IE077_003052, partial [Cardiosporidium cionae]